MSRSVALSPEKPENRARLRVSVPSRPWHLVRSPVLRAVQAGCVMDVKPPTASLGSVLSAFACLYNLGCACALVSGAENTYCR